MRAYTILIAGTLMYACTSSTAENRKVERDETLSNRKVLLELFTSQGCSSCPSADALVSRMAKADTNLIVISYHVDYWDRLGWKDRFSSHDNTVRQQQYVRALHIQSAYTPQAIVQGQFEMVGSNQANVSSAIKKVRQKNNNLNLSVDAVVNESMIIVSYHLDDTVPEDCEINTILVQKASVTKVLNGENSGKELSDFHIARTEKSMSINAADGTVKFAMPADLKKEDTELIVFIQNVSSKKILAVRQISI